MLSSVVDDNAPVEVFTQYDRQLKLDEMPVESDHPMSVVREIVREKLEYHLIGSQSNWLKISRLSSIIMLVTYRQCFIHIAICYIRKRSNLTFRIYLVHIYIYIYIYTYIYTYIYIHRERERGGRKRERVRGGGKSWYHLRCTGGFRKIHIILKSNNLTNSRSNDPEF